MSDDPSWRPPGEIPARPAPRYGEYGPAFPPPNQPPAPTQGPPFGGSQWGPPPAGYVPAWTPPPKPGLIPLRALTFGTLLGAPFQVLRRNPKVTVGLALLVAGIPGAVGAALLLFSYSWFFTRVEMATAGDRSAITAGAVAGIIGLAILSGLISIVSSAFLQGLMVVEVARETLGDRMTSSGLWHACKGRIGALVGWSVLLAAAVWVAIAILFGMVVALTTLGTGGGVAGILLAIFGLLGLLVLSVWLYVKLALVPSALVLERIPLRRAVARSWSLTRGYYWKTFGILALITIIIAVVSQIIATPITLIGTFANQLLSPTAISPDSTAVISQTFTSPVTLIAAGIGVIVGAILAVSRVAAVALIYLDLRMRKEGLDLTLVRFVEARQTGQRELGDPFLRATAPPQQSE